MARNHYTVSTPLSTIQRSSSNLIHGKSTNPLVPFIPEEVAFLDETLRSYDLNSNEIKHVSTISVGGNLGTMDAETSGVTDDRKMSTATSLGSAQYLSPTTESSSMRSKMSSSNPSFETSGLPEPSRLPPTRRNTSLSESSAYYYGQISHNPGYAPTNPQVGQKSLTRPQVHRALSGPIWHGTVTKDRPSFHLQTAHHNFIGGDARLSRNGQTNIGSKKGGVNGTYLHHRYPQSGSSASTMRGREASMANGMTVTPNGNGTTYSIRSDKVGFNSALSKAQFNYNRHRKHDDDSMSPMSRCWLGVLILLAQILLNGVMALCLFWVIKYHSQDYVPFAWKSNPKLEFNLHPVLMIAGFIYFMGQAMILYRTCRCCRRIWNKLLHTMLHILAIPCIVIGFIAVLDSHNLRKDKDGNPAPIPNFYSLHSWIGLTAMGLFGLQFVVGFFSFLLLLCCESATASFRANLVPLHAAFGGTTFVLAVAAACTGLTEKAFFSLSTRSVDNAENVVIEQIGDQYSEFPDEGIVTNTIGIALVALAIIIPWILSCPSFKKGLTRESSRFNHDI
ncbi:uncharacterized protein LOC131882483 isoform X3 [Tigriopus californicus]|uniref:uncharacterized protein LOC131882483 isoform X3 n=1 Tax=Tigriopus californicus TaxID=6832 RepID=UPI0027D9DB5A|nr:uncharacterized protein LOC131882483 isoform X3 [Tigriopus californicus]